MSKTKATKVEAIAFQAIWNRLEQMRAQLVTLQMQATQNEAKLDALQKVLGEKGFNWDEVNEEAFLAAITRQDKLDEGFAELRKTGK